MAKKKQRRHSENKQAAAPQTAELQEQLPAAPLLPAAPPPQPLQQSALQRASRWMERALKSAGQWIAALLRRRGAPLGESTGAMTMPLPAEADRAFKLSGLLVLGCLLLMVLFSTLLGLKLYSQLGLGFNRYKNVPIVYLDSRAALCYRSPLLEEPVTVVEQLRFDTASYPLGDNTRLSQDGKQLLFLNELTRGSGKLYLRDTARSKPKSAEAEGGGVLIAEQVAPKDFSFVLQDKAVLYLETKQPGGDRSLYLWQKGRQRLLTTQVGELLGESADHRAYYTTRYRGSLTLYSISLTEKNSQPVVIDADLDGVILKFDPSSGGVLYSKATHSPENPHDLYRWDGKMVLQIAEGISGLLGYGSKGEVFYLRESSRRTDPAQYFEDDMQMTDARMAEPQQKAFMVETVNLWGAKKTKLDTKAYEQAQQDYADKLVRDEIRKAIAAQSRRQHTLELCYSTGTSETQLDTGILQVWDTAADGGAAIYMKERTPATPPRKLSALPDPYEAIRIINDILLNTVQDCYYAKVGSEPVVFLSATRNEQVRVELDGVRGFYYIKDDLKKEGGILSYVTVQPEGLGVAKKLDDKVLKLFELPYGERQLYLRSEGETATLCAADGGGKARLAEGLPQKLSPEKQGEQLLFYRDYDSGRQTGRLTLYGDQIKEVGTQVWDYTYRLPNYIYLLKDYDAGLGAGNLYLYTGSSSKLEPVARDVAQIGS